MGNVNVGTLENRKQIGLIKGDRNTPTNTGMLPWTPVADQGSRRPVVNGP